MQPNALRSGDDETLPGFGVGKFHLEATNQEQKNTGAGQILLQQLRPMAWVRNKKFGTAQDNSNGTEGLGSIVVYHFYDCY
ncbi:hypothetical protein L1049_005168 [Liquidambar formosana]|uniref:Uncharacterized protein n=1 Tax=Liquidambar formosana TaxID=63359 RepID=A0AAP0RPF6_LIQFO